MITGIRNKPLSTLEEQILYLVDELRNPSKNKICEELSAQYSESYVYRRIGKLIKMELISPMYDGRSYHLKLTAAGSALI